METKQISCPHCLTSNRVPEARLADQPICGKCKKKLFTGKPLTLNSQNVGRVINNHDIPVLVDCWAPWCGPCRNFAPIFEQAAGLMEPGVRLAKLNTEEFPDIAQRWAIRSIPTLILFKNGKEIRRTSGALSLPQLQQWVAGSA